VEILISTYPSSMDLLIKTDVSGIDFFKDMIIPLAYYNLGSVDSLLNLKLYELRTLNNSLKDEELTEMFAVLNHLQLK